MMKRIIMLALFITVAFSLCVNAEDVVSVEEATVAETEIRENLALGKDVFASNEQSGNVGSNLTDGDMVTYWAYNAIDNYVLVDLEEPSYINYIEFIPEASRAYSYKIEASYDGVVYNEIVNVVDPESAAVLSSEFSPVEARYVKLTITKMPTGVKWINIKELRIYGDNYGTDLYCGEEGQGLSIDVDGTNITGVFTGASSAINGRKMTLIVAVFDENRMIAYNAETNTIPEYGTEFMKSVSLTIDDASINLSGKQVEVFIWDDLENMKTLVPPMEITIAAAE